jgi:hypothetical protein
VSNFITTAFATPSVFVVIVVVEHVNIEKTDSIEVLTVTAPDVPPPVIPVPAITLVIVPVLEVLLLKVVQSTLVK